MLLGDKHTSCCSCAKCVCGTKLPETVTLEIQGRFGPKEKYTDLVSASVKSTFGCGAQIRIKDPGGCETDARPLTREDIEIVNGGAGYAVLGRTQPTVTGRLGGSVEVETECEGYPTLNLTIAQGDNGGRPFWYLDSASGGACAIGGPDVYFELFFQEGTVLCRRPRMVRCGGEEGVDPVVITKGYFYLPDPSNVIVADIDIELSVREPGSGSGATITAVVDEDPESETFGQIVDVVVSGGEDYLAWIWGFPCYCGDRTLVLPQSKDDICLYRGCFCADAPGPWLVNLSFEACHGTGASAHATEPIGVPGVDGGPITKVVLDSGGSGYALLGRVAPTIDGFNGGGGSDATITATTTTGTGECGHPTWGVNAVTVTTPGYNYVANASITFTTSDGTVEADGIGTIAATYSTEPTLSIDSLYGTDFSLSTVSLAVTPAKWAVASVSASSPGTGFYDNEQLPVLTGEHDTTYKAADIRVRTIRSEPELSAFAVALAGGYGAELSLSLEQFTGSESRDAWKVASLTVNAGGVDYAENDPISFSFDSEQSHAVIEAVATVSAVSPAGAIEAVTITNPGEYWQDTGEIDDIVVEDGGEYALAGRIQSIVVTTPGRYYKEDAGVPALTTPVTVKVTQQAPSNGTGASFSAVVDTTPGSESFGQVTSVTINDGGDNYLAASTLTGDCYEVRYPGPAFDKVDTDKLSQTYGQTVKYQPPPSVRAVRATCDFTRYGDSKTFVAKCDAFTFTVAPDDPCDSESFMKVTPGGKLQAYDPDNACCGCCCTAGEQPATPNPGIAKCIEDGGLFYSNSTCETIDGDVCSTSGSCCVFIDGVASQVTLTASECDEVGGSVPHDNQNGCGQCGCTDGCGYDTSECGNAQEPPGLTDCGGGCGAWYDDVLKINEWGFAGTGSYNLGEQNDFPIGDPSPGGANPQKVMLFVRNTTPVDFSRHCLSRLLVINGAIKYVHTDCDTGDVQVSDMSQYWTLHDSARLATTFGCSHELSGNDPDNNDPCVIELSCAP